MRSPRDADPFDPVRRKLVVGGATLAAVATLGVFGMRRFIGASPALAADASPAGHFEVTHTDAEWRALLTPDQYAVLRQQGTERAFTSPLDHEKRSGTFSCAACANPLFSSKTKFDSGTGWPSFWQPLPQGRERRERHDARHGPHRNPLPPLRRPSRPRVRRRSAADRPALLHERRRDDVQGRRVRSAAHP